MLSDDDRAYLEKRARAERIRATAAGEPAGYHAQVGYVRHYERRLSGLVMHRMKSASRRQMDTHA
jgi:hypothetical protein